MNIKRYRFASIIFLVLAIILTFSSCESDTPTLCRINIDTSNSSRELNAIVGSSEVSDDYNIYYKSIYKGSGSSYGNMSDTDPYLPLPTSGILLSQGLWEIKVVLANKVDNPAPSISVSDSNNYPNGSSGDIFINLNTSTIRVAVGVGEGSGKLDFMYTIRNVSDHRLNVSIYKYDTQSKSFSQDPTDTLSLVNPNVGGVPEPNKYILASLKTLDTGVFYAKTTVTNTSGTVLFTDCIGFVIRKDVTTRIEGSYHRNISTGNDFNVSTDKNTGTDTTNTVDIKEWGGNEFSDGGVYKITEKDKYEFVCSEPSNRNKVLEEKDITIDLNGKQLINIYSDNRGQQTRISKTYFTISSGASLKIINSVGSPSIYGFESGLKFYDATLIPSFIVNSGTLSIGSNISTSNSETSESLGHITITGCLPGAPESATKGNAPIVISEKGGTVNLYGNSAGITITETCKGISTISDTSISNLASTNGFYATINMSNASINTSGSGKAQQGNSTVVINNYGILLDGFGKTGKIVINVGDSNHSASIKSSGSTNPYKNYGIRIENFTGDIEINISSGSIIDAGSGYGIYINCPKATAIINNNGTIKGSIYTDVKLPSTT